MGAIWLLLAVLNANAWLLPSPADKLGWGLRVSTLKLHQPFLAEERVEFGGFELVLINQSKDMRQCIRLDASSSTGYLGISIVGPDGRYVDNMKIRNGSTFFECGELLAYQRASSAYRFRQFGYYRLPEPGEYELRASLQTAEGKIVAPSFKIKVIEPVTDTILVSRPVPLEGEQLKWPKEKQERAVMQQIKVGNRTWLVYRQFQSPQLGGAVSATFRIAELPGKVLDMKVEGTFGDWNPLTITYREYSYTKFTTKHVINSVNGKPWTAEEEKHRQEKLKKLTPVPEKK